MPHAIQIISFYSFFPPPPHFISFHFILQILVFYQREGWGGGRERERGREGERERERERARASWKQAPC